MADTATPPFPAENDDHDPHEHGSLRHGVGVGGYNGRWRLALRVALACMLVAIAGMAASAVMVSAGEAIVVTQFGAVIRVITKPGLTWKAPGPVQLTTRVDLRLRTTSTGLQDVGTRDGLRILVQVYAGWSVPEDDSAIRQFLRAVGNDPDEAARQLRSFVGSALQVVASQFDLAEVVNTDSADYGGSGQGNLGRVVTEPANWHGFEQSARITVPPLAVVWLSPE